MMSQLHSPVDEVTASSVAHSHRKLRRRPNVKKLPLDAGWGWMVVLGCSVMHLLVAGLSRSYGVIYIQLQYRFNSSAGITAWVGGLCTALRMGLSPFGTSLSNRFGTRPVIFTGGLFIGIGCIISAFTPSTEFMFFSYAILTGVGGTLAYAPSLVLVDQYFNKYRAIAVGLGSAGSGIGVFGLPPLINAMYDYYGYMGSFLIIGGIMFNICICGALHRPLEANTPPEVKKAGRTDQDNSDDDELDNIEIDATTANQTHLQNTECLRNGNIDAEQQKLENNTNTKGRQNAILSKEELVDRTDSASNTAPDIKKDKELESLCGMIDGPTASNGGDKRTSCCGNLHKYIDLTLCRDPVFVIFIFGMGFYTMSYMAGQMLIPALGQSLGHSNARSVFLLSILGIADTISRTMSGFIFDIPALKPHRRIMFLIALIVAGSCNFLWGFVESYEALAFTCALHGLFNGCMVSQRATLVSDLLGVEKLSNSFGLTVFIQGCGIMIGPGAAGFLRDMTGAYKWSYIFTGAMAMLGATLFFLSSHHHLWACCLNINLI